MFHWLGKLLSVFDAPDASYDSSSYLSSDPVGTDINPANGLPMIGGTGGVDIMGNPYGIDMSNGSFSNPFNSIGSDSWSSDSWSSDSWSSDSWSSDSWSSGSGSSFND